MAGPLGTPTTFLPVLEQRENLGFHHEFGVAGRLLRVSRATSSNGLRYRFVIVADGHDTETHILLTSGVIRSKHLSPDSPAFRNNARVFLVRHPSNETDEVFFVEDSREMIALLRLNLSFLRRRNDTHSQRLFERLTGLTQDRARLDDDLCLELCELRKESVEHMKQILRKIEGNRQLLDALDRGELLDMCKDFSGSPADIAGALSAGEVHYLVNVVRARYFQRVSEHREQYGPGSLTRLGRKVMSRVEPERYRLEEKRVLLSLALRAHNRVPSRSRYHVGDDALLHGGNPRKDETRGE